MSLFSLKKTPRTAAMSPAPVVRTAMVPFRTAIIDIGSNSVRLVVYAGPRRNPAIIFNEKVMAGLGRALDTTGKIADEAMARAVSALERFQYVATQMQVSQIICVATAAVRDADNGADFSAQVANLGIQMEIISGLEEAETAALGVISAVPDADGIIGDLGGGSLDLAYVKNGRVLETATLPIGVLRLGALKQQHGKDVNSAISELVNGVSWLNQYPDKPFYLVGGSWRAVARFDMYLTGYPLRVLHHYEMPANRPQQIAQELSGLDSDKLRSISQLPNSRVDNLGDAASLLTIMAKHIRPSVLTVSAYGLREGLLYKNMDENVRARDPLLVAARHFGKGQSRFNVDGSGIYDWLTNVFAHDPPEWQRWLLASCHLADVGWQANPDFRAERGMEMALHGNWVGIDAPGRMMVAQALFTSFGGGAKPYPLEHDLVTEEMIAHAISWGLAIRLAQRITGGTRALLAQSSLSLSDKRLRLCVPQAADCAPGEVVERRLRKLASALNVESEIIVKDSA